ncbi:hypothetical protein BDY21DRAFT_290086, partial [Lineolata rhizophorae]
WYRGLAPQARMLLGVGIMAWGLAGLWLSDRAEQAFGFTPTDEDKARLAQTIPKIRTVDREQSSSDRR